MSHAENGQGAKASGPLAGCRQRAVNKRTTSREQGVLRKGRRERALRRISPQFSRMNHWGRSSFLAFAVMLKAYDRQRLPSDSHPPPTGQVSAFTAALNKRATSRNRRTARKPGHDRLSAPAGPVSQTGPHPVLIHAGNQPHVVTSRYGWGLRSIRHKAIKRSTSSGGKRFSK
jgi:hypothetical protein